MLFLSTIIKAMLPFLFNSDSWKNNIILIICAVVTTLYFCSWLIWITDFKYTGWIKGRF